MGCGKPALLSAFAECGDPNTAKAGLDHIVDFTFSSANVPPPTVSTLNVYRDVQSVQSTEVRLAMRRGRESYPENLWKRMEEGMPVLLYTGTEDALMDGRAVEAELRRHAKDLEVRHVEGAGHALFWENPEEVASVIVQFAQRVHREDSLT